MAILIRRNKMVGIYFNFVDRFKRCYWFFDSL